MNIIMTPFAHFSSLSIMNDINRSSLGSFDRIFRPEYNGQLLQSALTHLHEEEVNDETFENVPENKQEIVLPSSVAKGNASHKRVVERCHVHDKLERIEISRLRISSSG